MIVVTTVGLFTAESALVVFFFMGLALVVSRFSGALVARVLPVAASLDDVVRLEALVSRLVWFEIALVAVWSVCFKAVLYTTLRHSVAHVLLSRGQSLGIAIPAEVLMLLLALVGLARWFGRWLSRRPSGVVR